MPAQSFWARVCKRYYMKRFAIAIACLVSFALVVTQQYIRESETQHALFVDNVVKFGHITTARRTVASTRKLVNHTATEHVRIKSTPAPLDIKLKQEIKKWFNGTKTQYPLTINAPYYMENPSLCSSVPNLSVLVIVHTAPDHFDRRQSIRATWTNDTYYKKFGRVKVLFLLGLVNNPILQTKLEQEFKVHGDLLQGMFIDAYRNLTHKGVMGYKWISERCRNAKFILKVDDDIVVDMFRLFTQHLPKYRTKKKQIFCNHIHPGTMLIIRDKKSKWFVDNNIFRGHKYYPRYCSGFMVLFTNDVIPAIYRSSSITPFFWVDDVYLYGLAPGNVPGIQYNDLKKGSHELTGPNALKCYRNASRTCNYLVTGAGQPSVMAEIWKTMVKLHEKYERERKPTTVKSVSAAETSTEREYEDETKPAVDAAKVKANIVTALKANGLLFGNQLNQLENLQILQRAPLVPQPNKH